MPEATGGLAGEWALRMMPLNCLKWVPTREAFHRVEAPCPNIHMYRHVHAHTGTKVLIRVHSIDMSPRSQAYVRMHTGCVHIWQCTHVPQAMQVHGLSTPIHRYAHTWAHTYMHIHPYLWCHTPHGGNR